MCQQYISGKIPVYLLELFIFLFFLMKMKSECKEPHVDAEADVFLCRQWLEKFCLSASMAIIFSGCFSKNFLVSENFRILLINANTTNIYHYTIGCKSILRTRTELPNLHLIKTSIVAKRSVSKKIAVVNI